MNAFDNRFVDWRKFMSDVEKYGNLYRPPTPCCIQPRKRHTDLLMRTAPITGGVLPNIHGEGPEQHSKDTVMIVSDKLVHRTQKLPWQAEDIADKTPHYMEQIRTKAECARRAVQEMVDSERLERILKGPDAGDTISRSEAC